MQQQQQQQQEQRQQAIEAPSQPFLEELVRLVSQKIRHVAYK